MANNHLKNNQEEPEVDFKVKKLDDLPEDNIEKQGQNETHADLEAMAKEHEEKNKEIYTKEMKNHKDDKNKKFKVRETDKNKPDIKSALNNLYQNEDDKEGDADLSEISHDKKAKLKRILYYAIFGLVLLSVLTIAGFYIFNPTKKFEGKNITIQISGPTEQSAGRKITYDISTSNMENVELNQALLQIKFPDAFVFSESTPAPSIISETKSNASWNLGTLKTGQIEKITVSGILLGDIDSTQVLSALLIFKPQNFNYEFNQKNSFSTQITKAEITSTVENPLQTLVNEENEYFINIKNNLKDESLKNFKISVVYPEFFNYTNAEPLPSKENNI